MRAAPTRPTARWMAVSAAALAVAALSGCDPAGAAHAGGGAGGSTPASTAAGTRASAAPGTEVSAPASGAPGTARCTLAGLNVTISGADGAAGHSSAVVVFRNTGSAPCRLYGYPGVAALDAGGRQVAQAQRTLSGYAGGATGLTDVTLAPGQDASAVVEALNANPDGTACQTVPALLVTPPDEVHSQRVAWTGGCTGFQIHPVVPGDTGRD